MKSKAQILKAAFDTYYPAPLDAWKDFADKCEVVEIKKDTVLKQSNTSEKHFYFIVHGMIGVFLWKENNQVCLDFAFENHFFADYMSLLTGQSTPIKIMVLEDATLFRISRKDYLELGSTEIGTILMRVAAENSFISKQQQQIDLLTKTAEQRYSELFQQLPEVVQRVAQKHLASYLGITPQSFSRIRKNIAS